MPIWICKQCGQSKPMVEFKRARNGNYLDVCAKCSPSRFSPKLPFIRLPGRSRPSSYTPRFCEKCGYIEKRDHEKPYYRCRCRRDYDLDGNRKPVKIDRTQWFGLPKEKLAERMRWYQSALERKAGVEIQEIAHSFHTPYRSQWIVCGYIVDFFYPKVGVVVEIDGPHHDTPAQAAADSQRDEHLQSAGFRVVHISYKRIDASGAKEALLPLRRIIQAQLGNPLY